MRINCDKAQQVILSGLDRSMASTPAGKAGK